MIGRMGRPAAVAALVVALGAVAAGCMPAPVTEQGRAVRDLWGQFLVAAALVGGLVWILITISIVRFRRRGPDPSPARAPQAAAGSAALELLWTGGPIAIVLVLFWLTLGAMGRIDARSAGGVTVDVTAYRWQWRFDYPDLGVTVQGGPGAPAEMVVPVGEPIHIVLTSADVAHAFYVPQFLFKRDAIPGRTTEFDVTISEPGGYGGQCAEFCGVFHDRMLLTVRAETRADFDAWVASRRASAAPAATASGSAAP